MKKMKRILALVLALAMILALGACGSKTEEPKPTDDQSSTAATEITLWTYPIGGWGDEKAVKELTDAFEAETGIKVTVEYLAYADGDDKVNAAITAGKAPDLIMEGPERLVANWGAKGYMVDLADLLDDTDKAEIQESVLNACTNADGAVYEYPLVMTAHCMASNYDAFVAAGADQYVDIDSHTWTTEDFIAAVDALYAYYKEPVGDVYCSGQGGDQGTRALVNNLYGGTFTNAEHTAYTADSPENIKALELLQSMDGIYFNAAENGGEEITLFRNGTLQMAFCWNISQEVNNADALTFDVLPMAFPSDTTPSLQGGIWGFGVFDNGDAGKIEAAKTFIKYMCDSEATADAVKAANYFAVRDTAEGADLSTIWADNEVMASYNVLMPLLGDYYQVTTGWAEARTCWWNMLQQVGASDGSTEAITAAVEQYVNQANGQ